MADSDSGTHISDITENIPEEHERQKQEECLESITESNTTKKPKTISLEENQSSKKAEIIELKNVKNTARLEENDHNSSATQNTNVMSPAKTGPQTTAVQEHRTQRKNSRSINGVSHVTTAHVHSAPRVYRKINGELPPGGKRRQRSLPPEWSQTGNIRPSRGIDNMALSRSFESFQYNTEGAPRTAYDFMDVEIRSHQPKRAAVIDMDTSDREESADGDRDEGVNDASWVPTGIFAVFVVTLWTAVLKLVDSIEQNGPIVCTEGEEVRLWICAGCLSLVFCLAEITWKSKSLVKALFGTILVFMYMMLGHAQPLSCRLGEARLSEIGQWQAAINFFFAALLGTRVYQEIVECIHLKKKKKQKGRKEERDHKRNEEESSDEGSTVMRVYRV